MSESRSFFHWFIVAAILYPHADWKYGRESHSRPHKFKYAASIDLLFILVSSRLRTTCSHHSWLVILTWYHDLTWAWTEVRESADLRMIANTVWCRWNSGRSGHDRWRARSSLFVSLSVVWFEFVQQTKGQFMAQWLNWRRTLQLVTVLQQRFERARNSWLSCCCRFVAYSARCWCPLRWSRC